MARERSTPRPPSPSTAERRDWLTTTEVARLCGVSANSILRWVAAGLFPRPLHLGRRARRWRRDTILALLDREGTPCRDR